MARINDGGPDAPPPPPSKPIVLGGAIGQRYNELGGKKWGYPQHTEQATPDGRGRYVHFRNDPRNVVTMSIYWSPESGAHEIFGQIRKLWESFGWERSFLGYPTSGEVPTHDGVGRWQTFQGGVVCWHPDVGTFEVHGSILKRFGELGGSAWGYPTTNETKTPDGRGRFNHFRNLETGAELSIYWTPETGAHEISGLIRNGWASYGWERSALGYPTSGEMALPKGGTWQTFEGGIYVWHPDTGAHEVHGAILERYTALGGSEWGYPITDEGDAKGPGRFNHFREVKSGAEKSIHWSPQTGAVEVYGLIRQRWAALNWEHSYLGYPVSPETAWADGGAGSRQQQFQGGRVLYRYRDEATAPDPIRFDYKMGKGAGFGCDVHVELRYDGTMRFFGEATNTPPAEGYDYEIGAMLRQGDTALMWRTSGDLPKAVTRRTKRSFNQQETQPLVTAEFFNLQTATFDVQQNHEGHISSVLDDVLSTGLAWAATTMAGPLAISVIYAGIGLGAVATGGSWNAGPRIIAGSLWMLGPEGYLVGMAVDSLARIGSESRGLEPDERKLLELVFGKSINLDAITLTDTKGLNGRKFAFPSPMPDTQMNLNLGDSYKKKPNLGDIEYASLLAHEATHAWQYKHMANHSSYVLRGIFDSEYKPGALGKKWGSYNIEQQATIVEDWVRRRYKHAEGATGYGLSSPDALNDGEFQYIKNHIRLGKK